jgi:serine/threonine protein kinase
VLYREGSITVTVQAQPQTTTAWYPAPAAHTAAGSIRAGPLSGLPGNPWPPEPDRPPTSNRQPPPQAHNGPGHRSWRAVHPAGPSRAIEGSIVDGSPLRTGDPVTVNGYRLLSRLGVGGMAIVYGAIAPTGRPAAVKVLRDSETALLSCRREFQLASTVDQSCTAPMLGFGTSTAGPYLAMAYLQGFRCGTTMMGQRLPDSWLWAFGWALARTLAMVHAHGVVHCDVKPANLFIGGDHVRMIDFGIARYIGERFPLDGTVLCSRRWAAPEQLLSTPATPAVDVFAWGCLLAQLASGVHPFASRSDEEWILRIQSAEPDLSGIPRDLLDVIRPTLARNPSYRPTAGMLADICRARR